MSEFSFPAVQRCIDLANDLQQIPSPTFHEGRKAEIIRQRFQALGLSDVKRDSVGNILARIPGQESGRPLVFSAHMDTVFPENFPLTLNCLEDRIVGPGIGDNALGLAGLLVLPEILQTSHQQPRQSIWLAATTGEEGLGDLQGIRAVTNRLGSQPLAYISLEGIGLGNLLHRGLGVERYRITMNTSGGHSWADYGQTSAIHELAKLAARLAGIRLTPKPRTTLNIGIIQGGTSINTIASSAWMELDLRSENVNGLTELSAQVKQFVESSRRPDVDLQIEQIGRRPAGELPRDHHLIKVLSAILSELGLEPHLDIASTEANLPLSLGYPALTLGLTTGGHAHSAQEYIQIGPIEKGLLQIQRLSERIQV
jgi:tripeptide aminopeptidase